jgi:hypothetical protein
MNRRVFASKVLQSTKEVWTQAFGGKYRCADHGVVQRPHADGLRCRDRRRQGRFIARATKKSTWTCRFLMSWNSKWARAATLRKPM